MLTCVGAGLCHGCGCDGGGGGGGGSSGLEQTDGWRAVTATTSSTDQTSASIERRERWREGRRRRRGLLILSWPLSLYAGCRSVAKTRLSGYVGKEQNTKINSPISSQGGTVLRSWKSKQASPRSGRHWRRVVREQGQCCLKRSSQASSMCGLVERRPRRRRRISAGGGGMCG